jgi:hypothetical protein
VTVRLVLPLMLVPPTLALTVVAPAAAPVASPLEPLALATVAMAVFAAVQVTCAVRSIVELSLSVPVACSCSVDPTATDPPAGVMAIDDSVAEETVSPVEALTPEVVSSAVIVVIPGPLAVAVPALFEALEMLATPVFDDDHDTARVTSSVVLSLNIAVAVYGIENFSGRVAPSGESVIEETVAEVTVSDVDPVTPL